MEFSDASASAQGSGVQADLRSSAAVLTPPIVGGVLPTAPAGGLVVGAQTWVCDASMGFAPAIDTQSGDFDSFLAIGTQGNIKLPISSTMVPATCAQSALASDGSAYITQAVVDTKNTPSTARGILRVALDPNTGLFQGASSNIATTAGLDGNQPTAAALGPDGNLYVGFLKTWSDKAGNAPPLSATDPVTGVPVTFPDLNSPPFGGEEFQTNLIMPEPCPFLSRNLPPCSIIRPTETEGIAMNVVNFLTNMGLFIGQSAAFFKVLKDLAQDADAARRGVFS